MARLAILAVALAWIAVATPWWFMTYVSAPLTLRATAPSGTPPGLLTAYVFPWGTYIKGEPIKGIYPEGWFPFFQSFLTAPTFETALIGFLDTLRFAILLAIALGVTRQILAGKGQLTSFLRWAALIFVGIAVFAVAQLLENLFISPLAFISRFPVDPGVMGVFLSIGGFRLGNIMVFTTVHVGLFMAIATIAVLFYAFYASSNERLRENARELSQNAKELARSNTELEQFAYVASHDLREPLRVMGSYTHLLEKRYKGKLDSDADKFIAHIANGANRMHRLINELLAYSRVGKQDKPSEPTDCVAVFDEACVNLRAAIEESDAMVTHGPLPTVMANSSQLGQVFQNIIGNAIKFRGKEPPRVHVSSEKKEKEWFFSVRDNGIGIDPKYADRLFGVFQRLHEGDYPGTGIGLAISKKIVERHGGRIWMESQPGQGTTFYFTIPMK